MVKSPSEDYARLLLNWQWQRCRLNVFNLAGWACQGCGAKDDNLGRYGQLHIHHLRYTASAPWEEPGENLRVLCDQCHTAAHDSAVPWTDDDLDNRMRTMTNHYRRMGAQLKELLDLAAEVKEQLRLRKIVEG